MYHFSTDGELNIIAWDDNISAFTGKLASEVIGRKYYEAFPRIFDNDEDALLTVLKKKSGLSLNGHLFLCLFDQMKVDISIKPVVKDGKVKILDITVAPDALCPVAERLGELQRFVDIGKIASTLAHGVRNPLNAIKGAVIYLRDKYPKEPPLVEFTKIIEYEIARLDMFITRFLSSSVSESELSETDINTLLERIRVVTSFQAQTSHVDVVYELGAIPPIKANTFQIEQAVLNVINNALRAMSSGGQLRVRTLVDGSKGRNYGVIEVADTGPGMMDRRLVTVASENSRGKGFGLFITHEVLKNHGGHLEVNSKKGTGTTMRLYLPLS